MSETALIRLSRLTALRRELDTVANNVANVGTTGFKARRVHFQEYLKHEQAEPGTKPERPASLVQARAGYSDLSRGAVEQTGKAFDVAIDGDAYFVVQTPEGERFTRDGAFNLDGLGRLVSASGHPVLGVGGPLMLLPQDKEAAIGPDGTVSTSQGIRGRLRLVRFETPQNLLPVGANLFRSDQRPTEPPVGIVRLIPAALEKSNVRPVVEMSRLVEITRAYELVSSMMKQDDDKNELQRLADLA